MIRWLSCAVLIAMIQPLYAQQKHAIPQADTAREAPRTMLGAYAGYQRNFYRADMTGLPGTPSCCPRYTDGDGGGFALGGLVEVPLSGAWMLQVRAGFAMHDGVLADTEPQVVLVGGAAVPALIEHRMDARISTMGVEPLIGYSPLDRLGVYVGGRIGYVSGSTFDQKETLVEPAGVGTFENNRRTRNEYAGLPIPDASSLYTGLLGLVSYKLPLSRSGAWWLVPELSYTIGLNRLSSGVEWKTDHARAGLSVQYAFLPAPPAPPPPPPVQISKDPPRIASRPRLDASVTATGVDAQGRTADAARVTVEEFESMQVRPLLSYIFFDSASSTIPSRYEALDEQATADFTMDKLYEGGTIDSYHHLLNVVGRRLRDVPNATIRVTGCNAGTGAESGNLALSRARADAVAAYLTRVWRVDRSRVAVDARDLPENPSRTEETDGVAENRRVEITSDDDAILDPLVTRAFERRVTRDIIRFLPSVRSEAPVRSWELRVMRGEKEIRAFRGEGMPKEEIDWHFADDLPGLSARRDTLSYRLTVTDTTGQTRVSDTRAIDVREITVRKKREDRVADNVITRLNLILFDFNSPQLGRRNERIISQYIRPVITSTGRVRIAGYTDRIGEEASNRALSQQRADNTARMLRVPAESVQGMGETAPLYDNALPEGRLYNRTVEIVVETPTKPD
ncbi:MAG: OmpA family protein [Ignavibacteria bacterium]|nr:OmpA family protein [Ignavibacteria bacterium]